MVFPTEFAVSVLLHESLSIEVDASIRNITVTVINNTLNHFNNLGNVLHVTNRI